MEAEFHVGVIELFAISSELAHWHTSMERSQRYVTNYICAFRKMSLLEQIQQFHKQQVSRKVTPTNISFKGRNVDLP